MNKEVNLESVALVNQDKFDPARAGIKSRLSEIQNRFHGFKDGLIANRQKRLDEQNNLFEELEKGIKLVNEQVKELAVSRIKSLKQSQSNIMDQLDEWATEFSDEHLTNLEKVNTILIHVKTRLSNLEVSQKKLIEESTILSNNNTESAFKRFVAFKKQYGNSTDSYSTQSDGLINTMRDRDKVFNQEFQVETRKCIDDANKLGVIIDKGKIKRQELLEQFRHIMEDKLCQIIKRIKEEDKTMKEQRNEFLQNVEHFTKRLRQVMKTH